MLGTTGYLKAMEEDGLYDSVVYLSGKIPTISMIPPPRETPISLFKIINRL
jgi:hypothetical protein